MSSSRSPIFSIWQGFALMVCSVSFQGCECLQSFKEEPNYTEVNPGATAELRCVIENIGGECRWQKDGKPIGIHAGKYEWAARPGAGDCSLNIQLVDIRFDDGEWQCQVTSSDFQSQDALSSQYARLVVREPPESYTILQNNNAIADGGSVTVVDGKTEMIQCESKHSNPPADLQWFLGEKLLKPTEQKNETESDGRRWKTVSVLEHAFAKEDNSHRITCKVVHPAFPGGFQETSVSLDLLYKPHVTVLRESDDILEEGKGGIKMTCSADANPAGRVFWRKYGSNDERKYVDALEFLPVQRRDSGTYICQAENSIGLSNEEPVEVDVQYPPKILRVTPSGGSTVGVHNTTIMTCSAEGNPLPKYQWLQKLPSQQVLKRGHEDRLIIENTSYDHQGEYVCEAVNLIGGQRKTVQSEPIKMEVRGAPEVLRYSVAKEVEAISGRDVRLEMEVCSDPVPSKTTWEWGSLQVEAGRDLAGRYLAEQMVEHPEREDCYIARLLVKQVSPADSRRYFLIVENAHGNDRYAVALTVKDPVSMASVIGVVIALLVLFVILVIILLYAYKKQKLCFKDDSKLDKTIDTLEKHNGFDSEKGRSSSSSGPNNGFGTTKTLPPDGMYHSSDPLDHGMTDKLWPENPTYQVYLPGYHSSLHRSPSGMMSEASSSNQNPDNRILYAELQFPVTSNFGSMKKRSQRDSMVNTTASTSVGDPSPTSINEVGSIENVHRYVPEFVTVSNRKTAV